MRGIVVLVVFCIFLVVSECCSGHGKKAKKSAGLGLALDPDEFRSTAQFVESRGYPCTEHTAFTDDGYYLGLFRIPNPGKPVVLLQHGLLDTSSSWVISSKSDSLAYVLHDAGYDVFLCNSRGNKFAQKHEEFPATTPEFWDFNWDQHASSDIPACINTALQLSKASKLSFIGHSQGASSAFAEFSRLPSTWTQKVQLFIALAPIVYLNNYDSALLKALVRVNKDNDPSLHSNGEFVFAPEKLTQFLGHECQANPSICNNIPNSLFGHSGMLNKSRADIFAAHWPDKTSSQNVLHWIKNARSGNFADFNGTVYDVSKIKIPTAVFCGSSDDLGGSQDCNRLINMLNEAKTLIAQQMGSFAHMDYLWAESASISVYPKILQLLRR